MREFQGQLGGEELKERLREGGNVEPAGERQDYIKYLRTMAGSVCLLLGTLLAAYVGGWLMLLLPVKQALAAFFMGKLTFWKAFVTVVKVTLSLTVAGAVWCGGYILDRKISGQEK